MLLGNWRHLAIGASPELSCVWFRPAGGDAPSTLLVGMRAALEGELHFGFVGVPALSIGLPAGAALQYERAPTAHLWSVGGDRRRQHLGRALHPLRAVLLVTRSSSP